MQPLVRDVATTTPSTTVLHGMGSATHKIPYAQAVFGDAEIASVNRVLSTPMIVAGPYARAFEARIAALFAKEYGIMTNSGSSANLVAFSLLRLPRGSEVITPALTFGTTIAPIVQHGLVPALVDVLPGTYQLDIEQIPALLTERTRALMVPSLIGNVPDYRRLREIADAHHLILIEDSCDTLGARLHGQSTGAYTDLSTTSFYASHVITAAGSGGMLCVRTEELRDRARTLVGWGRSSAKNETEDPVKRFGDVLHGVPYDRKFIFEEIGYNFQSTDINAAFGLAQLDRFEEFVARRRACFSELLSFFHQFAEYFILPVQDAHVETSWLAFPLTIRDGAPFTRIALAQYLESRGVQTRPIFTGNVLRQPAYAEVTMHLRPEGYPVADHIMRNALLIGCHHGLQPQQLAYLKETFTEFLATARR